MIPLKDLNPSRSTPVVTYTVLAVNIAVFLYQVQLQFAGGAEAYTNFVTQMGLVPQALLSPSVWGAMPIPAPLTLLTSMFVHGDLFHLAGNMLYLWVFADNVEDAMGSARFVAFYAACGLGAAGAQLLVMPESQVPMVGASGAIAGVLGAYMILYPSARVLTLVFLFFFARMMYLPAVLLLGVWFVIQLLSAVGSSGAGVAWFAHIGGFVVGVVLIKAFAAPAQRPRPPQAPTVHRV